VEINNDCVAIPDIIKTCEFSWWFVFQGNPPYLFDLFKIKERNVILLILSSN
jgi:hypothetical protein